MKLEEKWSYMIFFTCRKLNLDYLLYFHIELNKIQQDYLIDFKCFKCFKYINSLSFSTTDSHKL